MLGRHKTATLDYLRFFCAVCIVYFHVRLPGSTIALSALPTFVMLSIYFGYGLPMAGRAKRLLIPLAFWCVVYFGLKVVDIFATGSGLADEFQPWMLLTGPAIHLWYLPFIFGFLVLLTAIEHKWMPIVLGVCAVLSFIVATNFVLGPPFDQWLSVIPAAIIGVMLRRATRPVILSTILVVVFGLTFCVFQNMWLLQQCLATALVLVAAKLNLPQTRLSKTTADLSLGVYLIHPIPVSLIQKIGFSIGYLEFGFVIVFSIILTLVLKRIIPLAV